MLQYPIHSGNDIQVVASKTAEHFARMQGRLFSHSRPFATYDTSTVGAMTEVCVLCTPVICWVAHLDFPHRRIQGWNRPAFKILMRRPDASIKYIDMHTLSTIVRTVLPVQLPK
jgi:hypothetical protein